MCLLMRLLRRRRILSHTSPVVVDVVRDEIKLVQLCFLASLIWYLNFACAHFS